MNEAQLAQKVGNVTAKEGLQAGHSYLLRLREDLKKQAEIVNQMLRNIEEDAVEQRLAILVPGQTRELAPTKEQFVETFGIEVWEKMKRKSRASPKFVWKDDCVM